MQTVVGYFFFFRQWRASWHPCFEKHLWMLKPLPEIVHDPNVKGQGIPGALKGKCVCRPLPQPAIKSTTVANTANVRCFWLNVCITWVTRVILQASVTHCLSSFHYSIFCLILMQEIYTSNRQLYCWNSRISCMTKKADLSGLAQCFLIVWIVEDLAWVAV